MPPLRYVAAEAFSSSALQTGEHLLGVIGFDAARPPSLDAQCPFARIEMPLLVPGPAYEAWISRNPATWHKEDGVSYALSGDTVFGISEKSEARFAGLRELADKAYRDIFRLIDRLGRPHLLRVFNYLPRITESQDGLERYRAFNAGRHAACVTNQRPARASPAACALGTASGPVTIYFVASASPGCAIENPRQQSAYLYPETYGLQSPRFSRAMLHGQARHLFISGTAAIVGHESVHPGNAGAQCDETLRNIESLFIECGRSWDDLAESLFMRVYVKHVTDLKMIKQRLSILPRLGGMMLVKADICRSELLIEAEASCMFRAKR